MIIHSVVFKLKDPMGSPEARVFLQEIAKLTAIPGVNNLRCYRQTSNKNSYDYGLFMEFDTHEAYEEYNSHAAHLAFVRDYWKTHIADFLELDYETLG